MQKDLHHHRWTIAEVSLSVFVLFILLFFTYGIFVRTPYMGFLFNPPDGKILSVYVADSNLHTLQTGDTLIQVGPISWHDFYEDRRQDLFEGLRPGDIVNITVQRGNTEFTISWRMPGFNQHEFSYRFFNIWWLPYVFWLFGTAVILFIRPRDTLRRLLIGANYLTGLLLMFGSVSSSHLWESSILLHATAWLVLPVYWHLHWIFPKPFFQFPKWSVALFYILFLGMAVGEFIQALPRELYGFAFLLALLGSATLQGIHFIRRPEQRREVGFLAISILVVIAPLISLLISGVSSQIAFLTFFALPLLPLSYFFVIYRRQTGGLELRANRLVSAYVFLILICTILLLLLGPAEHLQIPREGGIFLAMAAILLTTFFSTLAYPAFQAFVEQHFLGIKLPYTELQQTYSSRITASTSIPGLLRLLEEEVFPSLLVRQFAFLQAVNGNLKILLAKNVPEGGGLPFEGRISNLVARAGRYIPGRPASDDWVRLILPLKVGDSFIGFWLLGRRDPDDLYGPAEIPILQSVADQTAIALSNILHGEQLRKMYQLDIERYEQERLSLALDLHDSVLNQLAILRNNLEESAVSPKFQTDYEELTRRLREIVSDLRPPMLMYGLQPAIEELAENLMERNDKVTIRVDVQDAEERPAQAIEQHLFRILQEACENAVKHSGSKIISISGSVDHEKIDLYITDHGSGFEIDPQLELGNLLSKNHFGLVGMIERAHLIGADLHIQPAPDTGTKVHVSWTRPAE